MNRTLERNMNLMLTLEARDAASRAIPYDGCFSTKGSFVPSCSNAASDSMWRMAA